MKKKADERIFGTQPEPFFAYGKCGERNDMLREWLSILDEENKGQMRALGVDSESSKQGLFKFGEVAEFVFLLSEKLRLPAEIKYLTLELLDGFMSKHVRRLYARVLGSESSTKEEDWLEVRERVRGQFVLRILSCCQVSTKMTSNYKTLTILKVKKLLSEFGYSYSTDSILKSELRVLKTLAYHVSVSPPLVYLEILLEVIGCENPDLEVNPLYRCAVKFLDLAYLMHDQLYSRLYFVVTGRAPHPRDRDRFAVVEVDKMLLAVSVIAAAAYALDPLTSDKMVECLCNVTDIPAEDVVDFATVLIHSVSGAEDDVKC